jgi:hypothetical protein
VIASPHAAADPPPESFVTSARPFLVPRAPDVLVHPVLTTGDVVGRGEGAYQMSGVPDGIGWYASALKDAHPSANDIRKGEVVRGHFERIPHAADMLSLELDKTAVAMGAWGFDRIEDQIDDPNDPGRISFAEMGRAHAFAPNGRVYKLEVDPDSPQIATLAVVLDSRRDDLASPDNLGISARALVIQEDRNWKQSGYNRVLAYDLATGDLSEVARTDPPGRLVDKEGPAAWESSGVVSVEDAFGPGWWLLDVQAHDTRMEVPDRTLVPSTSTGELDLVFIPGT